MRIGFYLQNSGFSDVDLSKPENGNPGIGGTQFMIWTLGYYLKKKNPWLDVYFFVDKISNFPKEIKILKVESIVDAVYKASELNIDVFIFRSIDNKIFYETIDKLRLVSIAWGHNFAGAKELKKITHSKYVVKYVCVSKQQYEMLRDHDVFKKSTYIYNGIDTSLYKNTINNNQENIICYIGSIIPSKGFHIVARHWKKIKKQVPNAKLYVIGSGSLYNRRQKLGKYNVAESNYEKKFMRFLTEKNGEIHKDVKFYGVLNNSQKMKVIMQSKIGIVNPTAKTETFGISGIEFQVMNIPVVTKRKNGFINTVIDKKTGRLIRREKQLSKTIIELLTNNNIHYKLSSEGRTFVENNFDINTIVKKWSDLLIIITEGKEDKQLFIATNTLSIENYMWLREINRNLKKVKILSKIPSIYDYPFFVKDILKSLFRKN